jgi:geranylgeranyl reductase family protein
MYDLIVIGAGPSGSMAARRAGQKGLRTLLIDKALFPRPKPCGGAVSEQALSYLDFELPLALQEKNVFGARVSFRNHVVESYRDKRIALLVTRSAFDLYLLERAAETGVSVRMGKPVLNCEQLADCVRLTMPSETLVARFVIVAEGAQGKLKHSVRRPDLNNEYGICLVTEVPDVNESIDHRVFNAIEIHFGLAHRGYGWVFPHRGYFSVGVGGLARDMENIVSVLKRFLRNNGFRDENGFRGHTIPVGGMKRQLVKSRIVLVGDAAGFVDSFSGEGIPYAIRSGQLAAETIAESLEHGDPKRIEREYPLSCWRVFGRNLKWSLMLSRLMHLCPKLFLKALASDEVILSKYLDVASTEITYAQYFRWLLLKGVKLIAKGGLFG